METVMVSGSQSVGISCCNGFKICNMYLTMNMQLYLFTPDIFPKQGWLEKKKKSSSFSRPLILKLLFFSFKKQKDFTLSYTSSVFFSTNANTSSCIKPCVCKRQSLRNQTAKVLFSTPAQEQTAEANTNLSANYRLVCAEVPKTQNLYISFPLPNGLCKHWRKQITVTQPAIKVQIV